MNTPPRTQSTVKTSTPLRGATEFASPGVSSLSAAASSPRVYSRRSTSSFDTDLVQTTVATNLSDDYDEDETPVKRGQIVKKSKDWAKFQPKRDHGLYKKIIEQPGDGENIASEVLLALHTEMSRALRDLLELFGDICGFQHVNFQKIYPSIDVSFETVINLLQRSGTEDHKKGVYLMRASSVTAKHIQQTVIEFLSNLVTNDTSYQLYFANRPNNIFSFLSLMCTSKYSTFAHTGGIIALKMITAYCKVSNLLNVTPSASSQGNIPTTEKIQQFLWNILKPILLGNFRQLENLRAEGAKEMWIWFKTSPEVYLVSDAYVKCLQQLLTDFCPKVRMAALEVCYRLLVAPDRIHIHIRPFLKKIMREVFLRVNDSDLDVATKCIDICTCLVEQLPSVDLLTDQILFYLISTHHPIAAASARYFVAATSRASSLASGSTTSRLMDALARLRPAFTLEDAVAMIVDAVLGCAPELQNWDEMISEILECEDEEKRGILLEIFCESVTQTLTNHRPIRRKRPKQTTSNRRKLLSKTLTKDLTPKFCRLLDLFRTDPPHLTRLMELLHVVTISDEIRTNLMNICNAVLALFLQTDDRELAMACAEALKVLGEGGGVLRGKVKSFYEGLKGRTVEEARRALVENEEGVDLKGVWLRLGAATKSTDLWEMLKWSTIFRYDYCDDAECLKHQLFCCKWYLAHELQTFLRDKDQNNNTSMGVVGQHIQEFANYSLDLLLSDTEAVTIEAFVQICDINEIVNKPLTEQANADQNLKTLIVEIYDAQKIERFCRVFVKYVIRSEEVFDLQTRKKYFRSALSWLTKGEPLSYAHMAVAYYDKHYEEFGELFDVFLDQLKMKAPITFNVIIVETIFYVLSKTRFNAQDLAHSFKEAKMLKNLTKRIIYGYVKTSQHAMELVSLFVRGIDSQKLNILFVLSYFVDRMDPNDCAMVYDNMKMKVAKENYGHPAFLNFMATLKKKRDGGKKDTGKKVIRKKHNASVSTTETSESAMKRSVLATSDDAVSEISSDE